MYINDILIIDRTTRCDTEIDLDKFKIINKSYDHFVDLKRKNKFFDQIMHVFVKDIYIKILVNYFNLCGHHWLNYKQRYKPTLMNCQSTNDRNQKLPHLLSTTVYFPDIKNKNLLFREKYRLKYNLIALKMAFEKLEINGNMLITIYNLSMPESFHFILGLLQVFDSMIFLGVGKILLRKFSPLISYAEFKTQLSKKIKMSHTIRISKPMETFFDACLKKFKRLKQETDVDRYISLICLDIHDIVLTFANGVKIQKDIIHLFKRLPKHHQYISSCINKVEGDFLVDMIKKTNKTNIQVLEVGMANGISSLYICNSIKKYNGTLTSIDPFQETQWQNRGVQLLKTNKLDNHTLIQKKSYVALPALLGNKFDIIFIDGWHTFDYTLIDFFYADKLLNTRGYIILDDVRHKSLRQLVDYINNNYKHYKQLESPTTLKCYQKLSVDKRSWNYHQEF